MNVPYYYAKTVEFTAPYLQLLWEKMCELGAWLVEVSKPLRDWLAVKIPLLLEWVSTILVALSFQSLKIVCLQKLD